MAPIGDRDVSNDEAEWTIATGATTAPPSLSGPVSGRSRFAWRPTMDIAERGAREGGDPQIT
jgi:hypothetical protein